MERLVVAVLVNNHPGVLSRVVSMFRRRGFNIDTLTVGETENNDRSRITISFFEQGDKQQIMAQLEKMPDVYEVVELTSGASVKRELVLMKIKNSSETRQDIMSIVDVFRAKVIDYAMDTMTLEITGEPSKLDAIIELLRGFGIIEMCRTGIVALSRGNENVIDAFM